MSLIKPMLGKTFGDWTVLRRAINSHPQGLRYLVRCSCNRLKIVQGTALRTGASKTCGRHQRVPLGNQQINDPTWMSWRAMHDRVKNHKKYKTISVCEQWSSFTQFREDMGKRPEGRSIDRIDPYGDYAPENCRWATATQQARNTRKETPNISGYKNVWPTPSGRWRTVMCANRKKWHIGTFDTPEEAAAARKAAEDKYWGDER